MDSEDSAPHDDVAAIVEALLRQPDGEELVRRLRSVVQQKQAPSPTLSVRMLGEFSVCGNAGWHPGPSPRRSRHLIAYLTSHPAGITSRDRLGELLWPDLDPDATIHRLHIAVSEARGYLRAALGGFDAIRCVGTGYGWSPSLKIDSDTERFVSAARGDDVVDLRRAAELYRGDFMQGESADWIEPLRVRYASIRYSVLERLAESAVSYGEFNEALEYGLELVGTDRGHEGAVRLVMRCFAALGRRGRALAEYEALRAYLRRHLGLEPTAETTLLLRTITGQHATERNAAPQTEPPTIR